MDNPRRSLQFRRPLRPRHAIGMITALALLVACAGSRTGTSATRPVENVPPAATVETPIPPFPPDTTPMEQVFIVKGEPPATSELALMMRRMADFTDSTGKRVAAQGALLPFPEAFRGLRSAKATPDMVDPKSFDPYAQAWLVHLDRLYTVPDAERPGVFNTLVQTCAACHGNMCPGPLVRINKMKIPAPEP
jgi:hypothetical protein